MNQQDRLSAIKAAAEKRKATKQNSEILKKKIELSLKTINDYQRMRQNPTGIENVLSGIFSKANDDKTIKNYALNYHTKDRLSNKAKEIEGFIKVNNLDDVSKQKYMDALNQVKTFIDNLPDEMEINKSPALNPTTPEDDIDDPTKEIEMEISGLRSQQANIEQTIEKLRKGKVDDSGVSVSANINKIPELKKQLIHINGRLQTLQKELSAIKTSKTSDSSQMSRDEWLSTKAAATKATPLDTDPEAEAFYKAHPELRPTNESLTESTVLFKTIQTKTGLPEAQLKEFWELAKKKSGQKFQENDSLFWSEVMKEFQHLVDRTDLEEAKNIMETREKYKEAASLFLNSIAEDNYVKAEEAFATMVSTRLNNNIADRATHYCQEVLAKEAQRLSNEQ